MKSVFLRLGKSLVACYTFPMVSLFLSLIETRGFRKFFIQRASRTDFCQDNFMAASEVTEAHFDVGALDVPRSDFPCEPDMAEGC